MPRYAYKCNDCLEHFEVFHGMDEEQSICCFCTSNNIHRVPQMVYFKQERASEGGKVGDDVKRAIEENRAILKEEKKKRVEFPDGD
jgi:putative FmdB family regulatory protein